jgi:hypothetical protein
VTDQDILDQIYYRVNALGGMVLKGQPELRYSIRRTIDTLAVADAEIRGLRELNASLQLQLDLLRKEDACGSP